MEPNELSEVIMELPGQHCSLGVRWDAELMGRLSVSLFSGHPTPECLAIHWDRSRPHGSPLPGRGHRGYGYVFINKITKVVEKVITRGPANIEVYIIPWASAEKGTSTRVYAYKRKARTRKR